LSLNKLCKEYTAEWLGKTYNPNNISALYPYINNVVADRIPMQKEEHEIVFISRLVPHKHPEHVITCLRNIPNPPIINFICNPIHEDRIKDYQKLTSGTNIKMKFHMNIDDAEKFSIIKRCKAMVFPSTMEGFGMPPAEALYCEKPVVCYDTPFFREEYKDYIEYASFDKGADDLGTKLKKVLDDKEYRIKRGKAGKKYIQQTMTFEAYCRNLEKVILKVLPNGINKRLHNLPE
jgi:glycosyltransferase involved in cell wall biosynthesis